MSKLWMEGTRRAHHREPGGRGAVSRAERLAWLSVAVALTVALGTIWAAGL